MGKDKIDGFEALTAVQRDFGYKEGDIHPVAILGLFGEAGEVLNEVVFPHDDYLDYHHSRATSAAAIMDKIKKEIRRNKNYPETVFVTDDGSPNNFDAELGDVIYYANLLALNRGRTLESYALQAAEKARNRSKGM